jgi:hypothetical protein
MGEWGDEPLTFDRKSEAWGSVSAGFEDEGVGEGGGEAYLELIGSQLWVAGMVDLGRFSRVSDYVNIVDGYIVLHDVVVLSGDGDPSRLAMPELRVLPADIAVVGQPADEQAQSPTEGGLFIEKQARRLVLLTRSHIIDGDVLIQVDSPVMAFIDASDPKFIPMTDARVRRVTDRRLTARYPLALVQRSQILGVATEGITLGGAEETVRRATMLKAEAQGARDADGLGGDIGPVTGTERPEAGGPDGSGER